MTNLEIFQQVDSRMRRIKELITPDTFVLNKEIVALRKEIKEFQKQCQHISVDENGVCKYCLKKVSKATGGKEE